MTDRDKVIEGLRCCAKMGGDCKPCPYNRHGFIWQCTAELAKDAIALLEEDADDRPK